jgi:hypothetical protein
VILKPLIDLHGEPANWKTAAPIYLEALADIPAELLAKAVRHAIQWNPFFPKPGDLRQSIKDELADHYQGPPARIREVPLRLEAAPPSEEDKAYVTAQVERVTRHLKLVIEEQGEFEE